MTRIFISYRRSDSATIAGRIYDRLAGEFGEDNVFKDSYGIVPGEDFRGKIREQVALCDVLLVVIGPAWLHVTEQNNPGLRRLDNPNDWVRLEVETGLQRRGAVVIPVLVSGAAIPPESELPASLRELAYRNALSVRDDPDFRGDMNRLIEAIRKVSDPPAGSQVAPSAPKPENNGLRPQVIVAIISGLFLVIAGAIAIIPQLQQNQMAQQAIDATAAQAAMFSTSTALAQAASVTPAPTLTPSDTPTHTPEPATNTPLPPTNTPAPSLTPLPPTNTAVPSPVPTNTPPVTTSGVAVGGQAEVRGSNESDGYQNLRTGVTRDDPVIQQVPARTVVTIIDGPVASEGRIWWKVRTPDGVEGWTIESSATRQTLVPVERITAALRLIADAETLTLVVTASTAVNLNGLEFRVTDGQGGTRAIRLADDFNSSLRLTEGKADPGACFVYRLYGSTMPLPNACQQLNRVFSRQVPRSDVFWYDFTAVRQRDVAVFQDGSLITLCAAVAPECGITWNEKANAPAPNPTPTATSTTSPTAANVGRLAVTSEVTKSYPCAATIKNDTGSPVTIMNIVRSEPIYASSPVASVRLGQPVMVLAKTREGSRTIWYQIGDQNQTSLGYVLEDFLDLSATCPP